MTVDLLKVSRRLLRDVRLPSDGAKALAELLSAADVLAVESGGVVIREGDPGDALLVIVSGRVRVTVTDPAGQSQEVAWLRGPILLGHIGAVDAAPRTATCSMPQGGTALRMPRGVLLDRLERPGRGPEVLRDLLLAGMFRQLTEANQSLRELVAAHPELTVESPPPQRRR